MIAFDVLLYKRDRREEPTPQIKRCQIGHYQAKGKENWFPLVGTYGNMP